VPKIVAVLITMVILAPWILTTLINFTQSLFQNIQHLAG
jgi:flagellar biosynthetic protein FliQ